MYVCMYGCMDGCMVTEEQRHDVTDAIKPFIGEQVCVCMYVWMRGWMDGWM